MNSGRPQTIPDPVDPGRRQDSPVPASVPAQTYARGMRLDLYDNSDFDRGAGRMKEILWVACKCFFFLNPVPWPSFLRTRLLRLFGARMGRGVVVRSGANISFPWRLTVGDHVWIGEDVVILSLAPVTIGSHVCISQRAFLCTGSHAWRKETFDLQTRPIVVEESVWISALALSGRAPGSEAAPSSAPVRY